MAEPLEHMANNLHSDHLTPLCPPQGRLSAKTSSRGPRRGMRRFRGRPWRRPRSLEHEYAPANASIEFQKHS